MTAFVDQITAPISLWAYYGKIFTNNNNKNNHDNKSNLQQLKEAFWFLNENLLKENHALYELLFPSHTSRTIHEQQEIAITAYLVKKKNNFYCLSFLF